MNSINENGNNRNTQRIITLLIIFGLLAGIVGNQLWRLICSHFHIIFPVWLNSKPLIYLQIISVFVAIMLGHISASLTKSQVPINKFRLWLTRGIYILGYAALSYWLLIIVVLLLLTTEIATNCKQSKMETDINIKVFNILGFFLGIGGLLLSLLPFVLSHLADTFDWEWVNDHRLSVIGRIIGTLVAIIVIKLGYSSVALTKHQLPNNIKKVWLARFIYLLGYIGLWCVWVGISQAFYFIFFVHID